VSPPPKRHRHRGRVGHDVTTHEERELLTDADRELGEYRLLRDRRIATAVEVTEPLVLISQIQRSGGTLLSQLFDAHPQCHAHPYELKIGYPHKAAWPPLDIRAAPEEWFAMLFESDMFHLFRDGYAKYSSGLLAQLAPEERPERFPFVFLIELQRSLFLHHVAGHSISSARDVLDAYMTSYFNAWLDNRNLHGGDKRVVTGFAPRLIIERNNVDSFFETYPDGKLVSMVREPRAWYASALKHHRPGYEDLDAAIDLWCTSARAAIDAHAERPASVIVLTYEDLVCRTQSIMEQLAERVGIDFEPTLLVPTFNGWPIRADSAFRVPEFGVIVDPVGRGDSLPIDVQEKIQQKTAARMEELSRILL
jgi:hypothetical protein